MNTQILDRMKEISGDDWVVSDLSQMRSYLYDETEILLKPVACEDVIVVKPANAQEISLILKYANEERVPVIPRGGGTGICGGVIPTIPGIILSLERLNKEIEIDESNLMITADSGVTLSQMNAELKKKSKLFFPIHPGDEGAQIGGMVAENAGGVSAVKHGIMRNHVKGLEVVLPTGEIVQLGGKLIKNNMGYDLLHMLVGSEGTLGIITKATLKLYARQNHTGTLLVSFDTRDDAAAVVPRILKEGITPLALEYLERDIAVKSAAHMGLVWPPKAGSVDLMIILEEATEDELYAKSETIVTLCEEYNAVDSIIAETAKDQRTILEVRSNVYTATIEDAVDGMDISVPPASIPAMVKDLDAIALKYHTKIPTIGHIGDGNLHNFILRVDGEMPSYFEEIRQDIYEAALSYGGSVTAEHGTGKTRKKYMPLQYTPRELEIMNGIKKVFDPNGILNPGTVVD